MHGELRAGGGSTAAVAGVAALIALVALGGFGVVIAAVVFLIAGIMLPRGTPWRHTLIVTGVVFAVLAAVVVVALMPAGDIEGGVIIER